MDGTISYLVPEKEQLEQYAQAFYGLSKLFQQLPCQKEHLGDREIEELFLRVRDKVCRDCCRKLICWDRQYAAVCQMLYEALLDLEQEGQVTDGTEHFMREGCIRSDKIAAGLQYEYGQARISLTWQNRMMEQRMAAGEQIFQTAELLKKAAESFLGVPGLEGRIGKRLKRELKFLGVEVEHIRVFRREDRLGEIYLYLYTERKNCVSAESVSEILSEICGESMSPAWNCLPVISERPAGLHFVPTTKYRMFCGISRITRAGELVSGDNFAFLQKDSGKVVMSLADGMGSGAEACKESEKVIELLEQFLEAGFPQETAVRMINSCMLMQNSRQIFSTIDLCMVDLYNARCDLLKMGAAPSFLLKGNEIEVIDSKSLPVGVLQQSDYESMHRNLASGNSIIMMTDGVLEAFPEKDRERSIAELIGRSATRNAKEFARRLMEKVYLMQKLKARDDMTILVGTIWEK